MSAIELASGSGHLREPDTALLRAVLDSIPGRVSIIDTQDRYLYANKELLDFLEKPASDVIGRRLAEVLGEAAVKAFAPSRDRALSGHVAKFEGWVTYFGKHRRYVKQVLTPYKSGDGKVEGFFFIGRDQTELKEREIELVKQAEALRVSEATRAAVVQSALDAVIVIDETGTVIEFNPSAERTFGYSRSFAVGRIIAELIIPPHLRPRHEQGLRRFLETGEGRAIGRRIEVEAMRVDRTTFPAELAITEMRTATGRLFAAHVRDLTETKAAQAEIEHQRERLNHAERLAAMGSLLASVAHELNNPLAIVVAQSTLLNLKAETEQVKRRANHIHAAAQRCARIVKSFLAMARQKPPERRPVDLNEIVQGALEMFEYVKRSSGIATEVSLDDQLGTLEGDPDLLSQVATNLILNAGQAVRDQAEPRRIWISTTFQHGKMRLSVSDNGPGVPADIKSRIFEPYFTTKPSGVGTGIGLSICKNVIESHGGTIEVSDREGGGAVFEVTLPYGSTNVRMPEAALLKSTEPLNILVVDDEPDVGQSLAEVLFDLGHNAVVELDATKALDRLAKREFDIVFADFRMPGLNGLDLRTEIRATNPGLAQKMIIVTGDTLSGTDGSAAWENVVVLEKPFTHADVDGAVRRVTEPAASS